MLEQYNMNRYITVLFAILAVTATVFCKETWRIIGGSKAEDGQFPYQISLRYKGVHICGGSIIDKRWIVTAAHCLARIPKDNLTVVVGTNKLDEGGEIYVVSKKLYNSNFNPAILTNDVGVLEVDRDIKYSDKVQAIPLNKQDLGVGVTLTLSGWGKTKYPGSAPNDLQFIELKTIAKAECQEKHKNLINENQICTFTKKGEGACHGDSGGPLVYEGTLAGIVSWGFPCGVGYPDVQTKVSSYADWINQQVTSKCV